MSQNEKSTPRDNLSIQGALGLANICIESSRKIADLELASELCDDANAVLSQVKKVVKKASIPLGQHMDQTLRDSFAIAYTELGDLQSTLGQSKKTRTSFKEAQKWGGFPPNQGQLGISSGANSNTHLTTGTAVLNPPLDTTTRESLSLPMSQLSQGSDITQNPQHIFAENIHPPDLKFTPPNVDERLNDTSQLACCLSLLQASLSPDDKLELAARDWLQAVQMDSDEQERLKMLATDVLREFIRDELKDGKAVKEIVCLVPVLEKDDFRHLLQQFYIGIDQSDLLNFHQLEGLAQLIESTSPGYLDADDLVKVLKLLSERLRDTHHQSTQHIYLLTRAVSHVLDAMADARIKDLDREKLHEPLSAYLDKLTGGSDPHLVYQAAYAYQALQYVPDNETLWQATLRRTGKALQGVSGLVSSVKGLDLNGFIEGLGDIQQGLAGASKAFHLVKTAYDDVTSLTESGQGFLGCLKEGFSFDRNKHNKGCSPLKGAWYPALRGADTLIRDGQLVKFRKLVCEAPCRLDPAFQWGVCLRLGEIAASPEWGADTRHSDSAVAFLGEMYQNDVTWGQQVNVKQYILDILMRLASQSGSVAESAEALLQELESNGDAKKQVLYRACQKDGPSSYPLKVGLPQVGSPSLLDSAQNKLDVEGNLRQLRKSRLEEQGNKVYIPPQAKASLLAPDDAHFPLKEKVNEFLDGDQKVLLLLGDSGSGKSTFNRALECDLWRTYKKKDGLIPLYISLPTIDKPEQDMVTKQLRKAGFAELEIRELKAYRKFILICDGYDESHQTRNLYTSNRLNKPGEWSVKMVISCRSEYAGADYRDRFQPVDRNQRSDPGLFQEAVIAPFSPDQVQEYIGQYVSVHRPLWEAKDYSDTLDLIPSLKDLVKNPFLLTLSLEVLPRMVDRGQHISATRVTKVALYDQFVEQWLERGKKRLGEEELSDQARSAFDSLSDEGFSLNGMDFLKKLSVAIYKEQGGHPVVEYSRFRDEGSWKADFFSRDDEKQLLREACPLARSGNQYRFIHRSLLEYGLARAVFDPQDWVKRPTFERTLTRKGSMSSEWSFESQDDVEKASSIPTTEQQPADPTSPLVWRNFVNELSVLQFLSERAQQEPIFKQQLLTYIELSKTGKKWRTAAANAITILVRAGVQFNGADLQGIQIPGADLSHGMFDSTQLQDADLRRVNLRNIWLRQADLSGTRMAGAEFGEMQFLKQESEVNKCAYSPDGQSFAIGLESGNISVYTTSTWEKMWDLTGHTGMVSGLAFSPKEELLASSSFDNTVRLWDLYSRDCRFILTGHSAWIVGVAYSPRGDLIASSSFDNTVRLWDAKTGDCRRTITGHTNWINGVAYSPQGDLIATVSNDMTVRLWDVETGDCRNTLNGHTTIVRCVAYSPKGDLVASGSDETVRLWDTETGICRQTLTGHGGFVSCVMFSPDGNQVVSCSQDQTMRLWDAETGGCIKVLTGHRNRVTSAVFSPKGDLLVSGSNDMTVRLWDLGTKGSRYITSDYRPSGHSKAVSKVKCSPKGDQVASCGPDATIRLWDLESGVCCHTLIGHTGEVKSITYSRQGGQIASGSGDMTVRLWDPETGACRHILSGHTGGVNSVAYSPQERLIASASCDRTVRLWDVETGACRHNLTGHSYSVSSVAYSPKDDEIASGSTDYTVRLWDVETGVCRHILTGHTVWVDIVTYSPHGDQVASGSIDRTMRLWDVDTGDCRHTLNGNASVSRIVYSPQGDLVTSANDETVQVWDAESGIRRHNLTGHALRVTVVMFSPRGNLLASGSGDHTVRIWDLASGQCRAVIQDFHGPLCDLAWAVTPNATFLITGCNDKSVRVWQVMDDREPCRVCLHWSSSNDALVMSDASVRDVQGLILMNEQLLKQRGAVGEPAKDLGETSKTD